MFRRNKKTKRYQSPRSMVTQMALESNFCQTVRFNVQVNDYDVIDNYDEETEEGEILYIGS